MNIVDKSGKILSSNIRIHILYYPNIFYINSIIIKLYIILANSVNTHFYVDVISYVTFKDTLSETK